MDGQSFVIDVNDGYGNAPTISMAQRLCDDVLYNVFVFGLPSNVAVYPQGAFILNVSQVCRAWRSVTMTNPNLWAEIIWDPLEGDEVSMDISRLERATLLYLDFLLRSQDSPLSIDIQSSSPSRPSFASFETIVDRTLNMDTLRRLRHFSLNCEATDLSPTRVLYDHQYASPTVARHQHHGLEHVRW